MDRDTGSVVLEVYMAFQIFFGIWFLLVYRLKFFHSRRRKIESLVMSVVGIATDGRLAYFMFTHWPEYQVLYTTFAVACVLWIGVLIKSMFMPVIEIVQ